MNKDEQTKYETKVRKGKEDKVSHKRFSLHKRHLMQNFLFQTFFHEFTIFFCFNLVLFSVGLYLYNIIQSRFATHFLYFFRV